MSLLVCEFHISPRDVENMRISRLLSWLKMLGDYNKEKHA